MQYLKIYVFLLLPSLFECFCAFKTRNIYSSCIRSTLNQLPRLIRYKIVTFQSWWILRIFPCCFDGCDVCGTYKPVEFLTQMIDIIFKSLKLCSIFDVLNARNTQIVMLATRIRIFFNIALHCRETIVVDYTFIVLYLYSYVFDYVFI